MAQVNETKQRQAKVVRVFRGEHPYVIAKADGIPESVTFSIDPDHQVWEERELPTSGVKVILSDIRKNDKGWRAYHARFLRPEDEVVEATPATKKGP